MSDWKEASLGTLADVQTGPFGSQLKNEQYITGGTPVVTVEHITNFSIEDFIYPSVTDEDKHRLEKYILRLGDIVFSRVGSVDLSALVKKHQHGWLFSSRMLRVRVKEQLNAQFLSYYLRQYSVRQFIISIAVGSTMPSINTAILKSIPIVYCCLTEQKKIAAVLSALDSKIELNNRINAELESLAKTIYDYWFVQFDFPDDRGKPYKSSGGKMVYVKEIDRAIPADWEVGKLGDWIDFRRGISYKSNQINDTGTPLLNLNSFTLSGKFKPDGTKYFNGSFKENGRLDSGDLVIAITDVTRNATIIGKSFIVPDLFESQPLMSCDVACVSSKSNLNNYYLEMLFNSEHYHEYIKHFASGTLVLHLDLNGMMWFKTFMPSKNLLEKFAQFKQAIIKKQTINIIENQQLTQLRDWLLPMLMNGQVSVK